MSSEGRTLFQLQEGRPLSETMQAKGSDMNENYSKSHERSGDREITWISNKWSDRLEQEGRKVFCHVTFEGKSSKWLVDTVSTYSVLNKETVIEMGLTGLVQHEDMEMTSYTEDKLNISGSMRRELLWRTRVTGRR